MIVTCEQCRTKFKIPDEKVTEKGVKVRCTRCQHTFRVQRETGEDPFAKFGPAPPVTQGDATKPGVFTAGVLASRSEGESGLGDDFSDPLFEVPTRVGPPAVPPPRTPKPSYTEVTRVTAAAPLLTGPRTTPQAPIPVAASVPAPPPLLDIPPELDSVVPGGMAEDFSIDDSDGPTMAALPPPAAAHPVKVVIAPETAPVFIDDVRMVDDFYTSDAVAPTDRRSAGLLDVPEADELFAERGDPAEFFEMGAAPSPPSPALTAEGDDNLRTAQVEAVRPSTVQLPGRMRKPTPAPGPAAGEPLTEPGRMGPGRARTLLVNAALAAVLLAVVLAGGGAFLNDGKLDRGSWDKLLDLFRPASEMSALDVSNGLYDTRTGRQIFYVRGEVENRSSQTGRAQVRVELFHREQSLGTTEGYAGQVPSPEELYSVAGSGELSALRQRLDTAAAELAPGQKAPFLVAFSEVPADLREVRVRLTVTSSDPLGSAAR